jgi:GT2 family glycosyltransferase
MKKVYLSVTSHNDDDLIKENFFNLPTRINNFEIILMIIDNFNSSELEKQCKKNYIFYYSDNIVRGYGENNNKVYELSKAKDDDIFIVCNPDITLQIDQLNNLFNNILESKADIYGVKVFESKDLSIYSSHNRKFPCLFDPLVSLIFKKKLFVNDADSFAEPDWIGGAFMAFKASSYKLLNGFDRKYFMYYEDTDICHRAKRMGMKIVYNPKFYIVHEAKRAGRKIFSKAFLWNLTSMLKYFMTFPPKCLLGSNYNGK